MQKPVSIMVNKLNRNYYSSYPDEQAAYERVKMFHEPIAALLALQPPGTLLAGGAEIFWLARQPGKTSFELVYSFSTDAGDRVENGMTLDDIEGLAADDLDQIADGLQEMVANPAFLPCAEITLPVWMDAPASEHVGEAVAAFEVDAHAAFAALPMSECDPRTLALGAGWKKIGQHHWISINEPNDPTVHLERNGSVWDVSVRRGGRFLRDEYPVLTLGSFGEAASAAQERRKTLA